MLSVLTKPFVRLVERYLPDPFVLVLLLTCVSFAAAILIEGQSPLDVIDMWGDGLWMLMEFAMQMILILVAGFLLADSAPVKRLLGNLAVLLRTPGQAVIAVSLISLAASWLNWGVGLVVGAIFARQVARNIAVDYRLLIASAYSGLVVWHGGLSGTIPLSVATPGHPIEEQLGLLPTSETLFSSFNLAIVLAVALYVTLVNRAMLPRPEDSVYFTPKPEPEPEPASDPPQSTGRPADLIENSPVLSWAVAVFGLIYVIQTFATGEGITFNLVILVFLTAAFFFQGTPRNFLTSLQGAVSGSSGIIIQFPFYAGIMGVISSSGLGDTISDAMVEVATAHSLPVYAFLSAGLVNIFVPSGGGQWALQAPIVISAAERLGADLSRVTMAVAWGDAWTNFIQPFWALPALAIAGLNAKDIMGFCLINLFVIGAVIMIILRYFPG